MVDIKFKKTDERATVPEYKTAGAAGADLYAILDEPITLRPLERVLVSTGLSVEIPVGWELSVRPRSGLALKNGVTVLNTPGLVDPDYRGTVGVILINLSNDPYVVNPGERIAQLVISKYDVANFIEVEELSSTERGSGGFGSTSK